jgi:dimethylglycine dehydrogenase
MKTHAHVVVIGGGVVGCSVLYHLAKLGWSDTVLLERKELTAGSSWHAAGGFHAMNGDTNVARLQSYTIAMYREIEKVSGQNIGLHMTGGLSVAATQDRWTFLKAEWARHRVIGLDSELLGPREVRELCPIMDTADVIGALYDPNEGHLDPSGATHAFAKAAKSLGAEIERNAAVTQLERTSRGTWRVITNVGEIEAEHVVNAAGLWAREVGQMAGIALPLVPVEHHYLITGDLSEFDSLQQEIPVTVDLDNEIYLRQERRGVLLGVYEKNVKLWAERGTPWEYGATELLAPDLDRIADALAQGFRRCPAVERAGIRRIVNGPFTFTPDGNPLVGPVPGAPNYWVACGVMAGFSQGGGVGLALAQWMIHGECDSDVFAMDVARFGDFATRTYTHERVREFYSRRFRIAFPNEFWPAGRPAKTSPLHANLESHHAAFGVSYGLEIPMYIAPDRDSAIESPTFYRSNAWQSVAAECRAVREAAGVIDATSYSRYLISGPCAREWLDRLLASRLPSEGRVRLAPMLSAGGRLAGDLTLMCLDHERFLIVGSGYLRGFHLRWFAQHRPATGVEIEDLCDSHAGIAIAGPKSRELLSRVVDDDVSSGSLPFMAVRQLDVGFAPAIVARLSVTGELGYEIYVPSRHALVVAQLIRAAGLELGARDIGYYALNSLRLEKSYGIWSREFSTDYTPAMCGLDRFIDAGKPDFIGRAAFLAAHGTRSPRKLVTFEVDAVDAEASGFEPVWRGDEVVGFTTSGGYGHTCGRSLAMGYVRDDLEISSPLQISVVGERRAARILAEPAVDPRGLRMRA